MSIKVSDPYQFMGCPTSKLEVVKGVIDVGSKMHINPTRLDIERAEQEKHIQELEAENAELRELINLIDRWSNDAVTGKRSCESAIIQISARLALELEEK